MQLPLALVWDDDPAVRAAVGEALGSAGFALDPADAAASALDAVRARPVALFAAGWLLVLVTTFLINHFDLFGLRQVWLYFRNRPYTHLPFKTPGLYKVVRHPLYVGWLVGFWATPTMTASTLVSARTDSPRTPSKRVLTVAYFLYRVVSRGRGDGTTRRQSAPSRRKLQPNSRSSARIAGSSATIDPMNFVGFAKAGSAAPTRTRVRIDATSFAGGSASSRACSIQ